jgi:hypothetical protein
MASEQQRGKAVTNVPPRTFYFSLFGVYAFMMFVLNACRPEAKAWSRDAVMGLLLAMQLFHVVLALRSPAVSTRSPAEAEPGTAPDRPGV